MKKYVSKKGNSNMVFKERKSALEHVNNNENREYEEYSEWSYRRPFESRFAQSVYLRGESLEKSIEENFEKITQDVGIYGASGYTLDSVTLKDNFDGTATLIIRGWTFSNALVGFKESALSEENMRTAELKILEVEEGEIPNGKIEFEIKK